MKFGEKLNILRKNAGLTQEEVASHLGISPQAVSKWENDLSCPDIMLLPELAALYGKTVDELLSSEDMEEDIKGKNSDTEDVNNKNEENQVCTYEIKDVKNKFLKIDVLSYNGDKINVKLPVSLLKSMKSLIGGIKLNESVTGGVDLSEIDFDSLFELVDKGVMGEIVNITSQNGDVIKIYVEAEAV